ncbi:MAG: hypothetical protein WEA77_04915 [Hyphomonas sp.]|uniref:hypothetical protein n=1 Tax=Hyphomonas sp. TaxID=87 RepID=UPI00349FE710
MKTKLLATISAVWLSGAFMVAHAASSVAATTGEAGSVIVVRGGETFSLVAGDPLFDGDRIVTRAGATVDIAVDGCTRTLPETSTIVIDAAFCEAVFASADQTILAEAGITQGATTGAALPILGVLAAGGAVAGAAGGGGGSPPPPTSN